MIHRIVIFTLSLTSTPALAATPLFQNTQSGMTVEQVLAAQPIANAVNLPGSGFGPSAPCLAKIEKYEIGGANYEVCFIFQGSKLSHVRVELNRDPSRFDYMSVLTLLRSRYGPELSEGANELGRKAEWLTKDGTNIALHFHNSSLIQGLNISYSDGAKAGADKL